MKTKRKFDPSEIIGFYITLCWLAFWFAILYIGFDANRKNLGDLGAYISGIFAPVAWLWFYLSYRLQREELKLQRQTLETQVEELKHSVQAQQGSEVALKEQSEALQKQLEITAKQFEHTLEQYIKNKPKFILNNLRLSDLMNNKNKRTDIFNCQLPIYNLGSDAKIRLVKANLSKAVIDDFPYADSLDAKFNGTVISITSAINLRRLRSKMLTEDGIEDENERVEQAVTIYNTKVFLKVLTNLELEIFYYSVHTGVGSNTYSLDFEDGFIKLVPSDNATSPDSVN